MQNKVKSTEITTIGDASIVYATPVGVYGTVPGHWTHIFRVGTVFMILVTLITITL